ncbi:hypothetical protein ACLX1H_003222 [Fusarium chlamydosporum]
MAQLPRQLKCVLLFPSSEDGDPECIPSNKSKDISINLINNGIRLSFPREPDRSVWAWYSPDLAMTDSTLHHITIELPQGFNATFRPLTFDEGETLKSHLPTAEASGTLMMTITLEKDSQVIGFGTPFHGENETIDSWINQGAKICGVAPLRTILHMKQFTFLVEANEAHLEQFISTLQTPRRLQIFGYGEVHTWDVDRYAEQIPSLRGPSLDPQIRFENAKERDTALTQIHVQDVWEFHTALEEVATMKLPALIWRVGQESVERTTQFVCLLEPERIFKHKHWRAARRALRGDASKLEVTFKSSNDVTWEAFHLTFASSDHLAGVDCKRRLPLLLTRPAKNQHGHKFSPVSHARYKGTNEGSRRNTVTFRCLISLYNEELRVSAINRLSSLDISPSLMKEDPFSFTKQAIFNDLLIGKGLWSLEKEGVSVQIPTFDLFNGIPIEVRDSCLSHVFEDDKERVQQYFGKLHLSLGIVSGPPGTGKSHLASVIVILMCFNPSIKQVYVTAASNGATDNILDRIDGMAQAIAGTLLRSGLKRPILLRGYSFGIELENCTMALTGQPFKQDTIWNPSPWKFSRSLCWWTLRALGSKDVPALTDDDNSELWDLHQKLSALAVSSSSDSGLSKFRKLVRLSQGIDPPLDYQRMTKQSEHRKVLSRLMELVVECANVVATTPAASNSWIYRSFNDTKARAVVFDEAATMFCSDALLVYGNTPRPMVAIGDPKQLAPNLTTAFELLYGDRVRHDRHGIQLPGPTRDPIPTNRFARFSRISWLSWFIHLGWPVFHLYTQHRMAEGLFDLSLNTVYQSLIPHFKYSPMCSPENFPLGLKVEEYLKTEYQVQPSPSNQLQPVFFDCLYCPCREYQDSLSRLNPRQADVIAKFLVEMITKLELPPGEIVVLTPYRANMGAIGRRFRSEPVLKGVEFSTFNRFQGREAQIVVLALCVDYETGPLFVADERSLNVALTRQRSSLLIFGDIKTTAYHPNRAHRSERTNGRTNDTMIRNVFQMVSGSGRIVRVEGDQKVDPDRIWKT